jgi:hypothetical protein
VLGSLNWQVGFNQFQAGFWVEDNTSSAARYIWTNVTGPFSLAQFLKGQPDTAQWVQETKWKTRQFYVQDTVTLLDDALSIDFGFKSTYSKSDARAIPGIAKAAPPASTQFAPERWSPRTISCRRWACTGRSRRARAVRQLCREHGDVPGRLQTRAAIGLAGHLGRAGQDAEARDVEELRRRLPLCQRPAAGLAERLQGEVRQPPAAV